MITVYIDLGGLIYVSWYFMYLIYTVYDIEVSSIFLRFAHFNIGLNDCHINLYFQSIVYLIMYLIFGQIKYPYSLDNIFNVKLLPPVKSFVTANGANKLWWLMDIIINACIYRLLNGWLHSKLLIWASLIPSNILRVFTLFQYWELYHACVVLCV